MKKLEIVEKKPSELKKHPQNYREHPDDQLEHLKKSIERNGFYRNIILSNDGFVLAGHGILKAAIQMELKAVPTVTLPFEHKSTQALKVLAGDNEVGRLAEIDDRNLTEILKEVKDADVDGLLGTGFDDMMLANLLMVTRDSNEISDKDEAAHWVGMPEFDSKKEFKMTIHFENEEDREEFNSKFDLKCRVRENAWTTWWPYKDREDRQSLKYEDENE